MKKIYQIVLTSLAVALSAIAQEATQEVEFGVKMNAIRSPKIVSPNDTFDPSQSGTSAPGFLAETHKWLDGEATFPPENRYAVVPVGDDGLIPAEWLLSCNKPNNMWLGKPESGTGDLGNGTKFGFKFWLPVGQTTTGRVVRNSFLVKVKLNGATYDYIPLAGLGPNNTRRWFTDYSGSTTDDPDAPIVGADYCGMQVRSNLSQVSGDFQEAVDQGIQGLLDSGLTVTTTLDFSTREGNEVLSSRTYTVSDGKDIGTTVEVSGDTFIVGTKKPTSPRYTYTLQYSYTLSTWFTSGTYTGTGGILEKVPTYPLPKPDQLFFRWCVDSDVGAP